MSLAIRQGFRVSEPATRIKYIHDAPILERLWCENYVLCPPPTRLSILPCFVFVDSNNALGFARICIDLANVGLLARCLNWTDNGLPSQQGVDGVFVIRTTGTNTFARGWSLDLDMIRV